MKLKSYSCWWLRYCVLFYLKAAVTDWSPQSHLLQQDSGSIQQITDMQWCSFILSDVCRMLGHELRSLQQRDQHPRVIFPFLIHHHDFGRKNNGSRCSTKDEVIDASKEEMKRRIKGHDHWSKLRLRLTSSVQWIHNYYLVTDKKCWPGQVTV